MKLVNTILIALAVVFASLSCTPEINRPDYVFPSADDYVNPEPEPEPEPIPEFEHKDAEGNVLFTTESEDETLEVGMNATPDGTFTLPDFIVTIAEGKITEIAEVQKPIVNPDATPCFIWIDAAANFPDFANSKENIARDLKKAAECGFTDIVVDIRPTNGDVLFKTDKCQQVEWLGAWVTGGFGKITRTATWDYLQAFIDEGHKLGLRVYAGFNTMVGGNTNAKGSQGVLFRDENLKNCATMLNLSNGITSIMDASDYSTKFFNPVHPDAQNYIIGLLEDLAAYEDLDGIILDRCRFDGFESDFSDYTKAEFEKHIDATIENWPEDVLPVGAGYGTYNQKYTKQWHEFRAKVIHDFIVSARTAIKAVNPDINFGAYVGGWYASYYEVGVNWASPNYNTSANYPGWATPAYKDYGYADHVDVLIIGAYASPGSVYGGNEWTMQGFCKLAKDKTMGDVGLLVGGPDVGNWDYEDKYSQEQENQAVKNSVKACADACDGYFLFDMIHLKKAAANGIDQWGLVKEGIDQLNPKN